MKRTARIAAWLLAAIASLPARADAADSDNRVTFQLAPYVYHYRHDPEHNNYPWLVGLEWETPESWLVGGAYFSNSFRQPSHYLYFGKRWSPDFLPDNVYLKLTGGILLGYKEPYDDKIPFNHRKGVAPGVLPALGYQADRFSIQLVPLGTAGLMAVFGFDLLTKP